jgi:hypothetical protein
MFDVQVCAGRQVALFTFRGEVSGTDFEQLDALAREARGGPSYDLIFDMTAIEKSQLDADLVARRGHVRPADPARTRIYVVPQDDLRLLVRLYAGYQQAMGWPPPLVVATREEAFARLGVTAADFKLAPEAGRR